MALLPLLVGAPLVLRRRAPLLMWLAIWAALALQFLLTLDLAQMVREIVAADQQYPSAAPFWQLDNLPQVAGPTAVLIAWLAVVILALAGRRRTAATIACVPALLVWPVAIASWKGRPGGPGRREPVTAPAARPAPPP